MDRYEAVNKMYVRLKVDDYKAWSVDKINELGQQILRMYTDKCDKEELIRNALMVEDAITMLWLMLDRDSTRIKEIKNDIYDKLGCMLQEMNCTVIADKYHKE